MNRYGRSLFVTIILLLLLPFLLTFLRQFVILRSKAQVQRANIVVDASDVRGPLTQVWRAIAQGGEEQGRMFVNVRDELSELAPRYVRIDHIYDHYGVVKRVDGRVALDWRLLDQTVRDILASGARPFFALSYMPLELSADGTILGKPKDWEEWLLLVQATIEHYSGKANMNLSDIYYEVWNEPDLFGVWSTSGDKNYFTLYYYAAAAAARVADTNRFFLGGPATTAPYKNWLTHFLEFVSKNNLQLDFISWHRYSPEPTQYRTDTDNIKDWLSGYPNFAQLSLIISEFSYDSELNPLHDSNIAAAHSAAVVREVIPELELLFSFELKDGLSPKGEKYWGRWGVVTHDYFANEKKPRYFALKLLSGLQGKRLGVVGEGEYVKAIASLDVSEVKVLLVNYDQNDSHVELVPLQILNLPFQYYELYQQDLLARKSRTVIQTENANISYKVIMPPNSVILVSLSPLLTE